MYLRLIILFIDIDIKKKAPLLALNQDETFGFYEK